MSKDHSLPSRAARFTLSAILATSMTVPTAAFASDEKNNDAAAHAERQDDRDASAKGSAELDAVATPDAATPESNAPEETTVKADAQEPAAIASWGNVDEASTLTYNVDENGNATITGTADTETERDIEVPSEINGHPVTAIGSKAFAAGDNSTSEWMTSIYLPNSITAIGEKAFQNCVNLSAVRLPEGSLTVGTDGGWRGSSAFVFAGCTSLLTLDLPTEISTPYSSVTYDGIEALLAAPSLKTVTFKNGFSSVPAGLFAECSSLESIQLPDTVSSIGAEAFRNCKALSTVSLPENGFSIGSAIRGGSIHYGDGDPFSSSLFTGCDSLIELKIPSGITIPDNFDQSGYVPLLDAPQLQTVHFPEGYNNVPAGLFTSCAALQSVDLPDTVRTIGAGAFRNCTALSNVRLPDGGLTIGNFSREDDRDRGLYRGSIFSGCTSLQTLDLPKGIKLPTPGDNQYFDISGDDYVALLEAPALVSTTFRTGFDAVPYGLFAKCTALESIELPDTVSVIEQEAFSGCTSLRNVKLPNGSFTIGSIYKTGGSTGGSGGKPFSASIFEGCNSLTELTIPSGIGIDEGYSKDGRTPLLNAPALKTATIEEGTTSVFPGLFSQCESLHMASLPDTVRSIGQLAFSRCSNLESVEIPDSVKVIGEKAFTDCTSLSSVRLPQDGFELGSDIFAGCNSLTSLFVPDGIFLSQQLHNGSFSAPSLTSVTFADGIKKITGFAGCGTLSSVEIPDSVTAIDDSAFQNCESLVSMDIPKSVQTIGHSAFEGCKKLKTISFKDGLTEIGYSCFSGCSELQSIDLPNSLADLGSSTFQNCTKLESVTFSEFASSWGLIIDNSTFENCTSLKTVTIPRTAKINQIANHAFYKCFALTSITIPSSTDNITDEAFALSGLSLIYCVEGSAADKWAADHNIPVEYYEDPNPSPEPKVDISNAQTFGLTGASYTYTGSPVEPDFAVAAGGKLLMRGIDYEVSYQNNVNAGEATAIVTGKGGYSGTKQATFRIQPAGIWEAKAADVPDAAWTGDPVEPQVKLTANGHTLKQGTDYTLSYHNNTDPGYATIVVTGTGNYAGQTNLGFEIKKQAESDAQITRIAANQAAGTAADIARKAFPEGSDWVVIARDDDFADSMSATGLAGALDAPILLTNRNSLSKETADAVRSLGATKAYVIGGRGAIPGDLEGQLARVGCKVQQRVSGSQAWDTSVECAKLIQKHGGNAKGEAIVATSTGFQDAVSISSFAYRYGVPIFLLTDWGHGAKLTDAAKAAIGNMGGTVFVPGGPGAVPTASVEGTLGSSRVVRMYGSDGYDTSNQIARWMVAHDRLSASTAAVACGAPRMKGVDALAGAALAGKAGGVMLLANGNASIDAQHFETLEGRDSQGAEAFLQANAADVRDVYLLGGSTVMPANVEQRIERILG